MGWSLGKDPRLAEFVSECPFDLNIFESFVIFPHNKIFLLHSKLNAKFKTWLHNGALIFARTLASHYCGKKNILKVTFKSDVTF